MPEEITFQDGQKQDWDEIMVLHSEALIKSYLDDYPKLRQVIQSLLPSSHINIAKQNGNIAGFSQRILLEDDEAVRDSVRFHLGASRVKARADLEEQCREYRDKIGLGDVFVRFYHNEFTREAHRRRKTILYTNDSYICSIVVAPQFQHRSIGTSLLENQITKAKTIRSQTMYAHCMSGSYAFHLFKKLGFSPIVTIGPSFKDGSSTTMVGKYLV